MADTHFIAGLTESYRPISRFPAQTPLAMAYVPMQLFDQLYSEDKALEAGTAFPELDKPFTGRRAVK